MRTHELKCWPEPFQATLRGEKRFEFRVDDRGFAVGDALVLWEWQPDYNGGSRTDHDPIVRIVTYVLHGTRFGVPEGFVVMSLRNPTEQEAVDAFQ